MKITRKEILQRAEVAARAYLDSTDLSYSDQAVAGEAFMKGVMWLLNRTPPASVNSVDLPGVVEVAQAPLQRATLDVKVEHRELDERRETYTHVPAHKVIHWAATQAFDQVLILGIRDGKFQMGSTRGTRAEIQMLLNELEQYLKGGNQ